MIQKAKEDVDWTNVFNQALVHVDRIKSGSAREDDAHYIFEAVLEAIYGKDVWREYNDLHKG